MRDEGFPELPALALHIELRLLMSDTFADVQVVIPFTIGHCGLFDYPGDHEKKLLREWVALAITDHAFMTAVILLGSCRHILKDRTYDPTFTRMVLHYEQVCLHTLRQEVDGMSSSSVTLGVS